jgi:hypothetical protein
MLLSNIKADITSDLKSYEESGLIDDVSLSIHLLNELKGFGGNVMETYPIILEVRNGQAKLPDNFFSLVKAVKTEPIGCEPSPECNHGELINSHFYRVREEASTVWDNQSGKFEDCGKYKEVTEKVFLYDNALQAYFIYGNHQKLKLVRGFDKSKLNLKCENIYVLESPYEINIINNTLQTNFTKGFVCLWYQGLLVDEETGDIVLPEDPNANIYKYLVATGKAKVFELLWANDDDPNVQNKLQFYKAEARENKTLALAQVRFDSITGENWHENLKMKNKAKVGKFNISARRY